MKITTKINLITTAWILCVLVAVNAVVFFSFMKITVNMEEDILIHKAQNVIAEIHMDDTPHELNKKLTTYLTNHSFIRIIQPDSKIRGEVSSDHYLLTKFKGEFSTNQEAQRSTIKQEHKEEQILIVRVPIQSKGKVVGTLEIGDRLLGLELGKDVLLSILTFCTLLGAGLSLLGGRWLSSVIMRPISNMINTMEDIEQSGIPKKIIIQQDTKDELQKMAVTFNRMMNRLDVNLDKQRQFISDASHEIKTPLTIIKSYADLLRRRRIKSEEKALDVINVIHSEATRIQKMTERLLELADTEMENSLDIKSVNIITLCENVFKQFKEVYGREINFHYQEDTIMITADELKIKQVIIILLDNAIKYSTDKIDVYVEDQSYSTVIRVKDYGIGIPEHEMENIFERFYRVDKARSRETGGTGLGLSIAKNIMNQHNGEIKVASIDGIGTEVVLSLPKR
ncbi:ATP-binding protein [Peribacillus simplex]|uniref:Signal transduction histidine-protein kinase ArlS n=1 Tax=Peribacillus simplex TaxID=1478 RepID=A0AAW7ICS6_9BACI|nr:ATP-binding protein [Peribacillus simplex]MDM5292869.1 ATP-binding protein [Peribacillus simplex]MDM5451792.1 ATP-binding protein [Peribacillus simplex]